MADLFDLSPFPRESATEAMPSVSQATVKSLLNRGNALILALRTLPNPLADSFRVATTSLIITYSTVRSETLPRRCAAHMEPPLGCSR
jgi:hypothetical protein